MTDTLRAGTYAESLMIDLSTLTVTADSKPLVVVKDTSPGALLAEALTLRADVYAKTRSLGDSTRSANRTRGLSKWLALGGGGGLAASGAAALNQAHLFKYYVYTWSDGHS